MLEGSKRRVLRSKKEFLRKADLAKREGYQVPGSYIELLSKPDDLSVLTGVKEKVICLDESGASAGIG